MSVPPSSTAAELAAVAETVGRYRERVAGLAEPYLGTEREDIVAAVYEAERQLARRRTSAAAGRSNWLTR